MVWQQTLILCSVITWFFLAQQVVCSGVFELKIKSFVNELGRDNLGECCSGEKIDGQCVGQCRTRFRVCLKHFQNVIDTASTCTFGDVTTPQLGTNNVNGDQWPSTFNRTIQFYFDFSWPGWFSLIVEAWHDSSANATEKIDGTAASPLAGVNIGERKLISRFPTQQWLDVKPEWTEREGHTESGKMKYEFRVTCLEHYYGAGCANLCRPRDDNFGHYTCNAKGQPVCFKGWKGEYCSTPVCAAGCDESHGFCNKPNECSCHSGWSGKFCSQCERYPGCAQGRCEKPWDCICNEGWGGLFCNQDLNYCTNHRPCRNGGTCFNTGQGSYTCSCPLGYTGTDCEKKLSNCSHKPCLNGAVCRETNGTQSYQCECAKGWHGEHCELAVKTCEGKPCQHGGICTDSVHGFKCLCQKGFSGPLCQNNIDDCRSNPCRNGGTCLDQVNGFSCKCVLGYVGERCEERLDYCMAMPCANGGTCKNLINDFSCTCRPSFTGKHCDVHMNRCATNPCRHGGTCYNTEGGSAQCECKPGYAGQFCEEKTERPEVAGIAGSTAGIASDTSRHVSVVRSDDLGDELKEKNWKVIVIAAVAIPAIVILAVLYVMHLKRRRNREKERADDEARMQNEQNSVHSSCVTIRGDTHMIKNTWGQCGVKEVESAAADQTAAEYCYPKQVSYVTTVPADPNVTPVAWDTLHRSRSQKQLNVEPLPLQRHSVYNHRVSCKDLDKLVRTTNTPVSAPLDNRLSVLSINISR